MAGADLRNVRIEDLDREYNVRRSLGDLTDLAESIRDVGVLTPVTVTPKGSDGWYLVAGHRRVAAASSVGLETVPALVHTAGTADERTLATLLENLQRLDLDPVEEAYGYRRLVDAGWSQAEVSRRVRRSRGHVSKRLRLLGLPDEVQEMVSAGEVTVEHAYVVSRLAEKGVAAEDLTEAAHSPQFHAERSLAEIEASEEREVRRAVLEAQGVTVELVDSWWETKHQHLDRMALMGEGTHTDESCHAVVLSINDRYDGTGAKVEEQEVCTDYDRHRAGGASPLQLQVASSDAEERQRVWEAERAAKEAEKARRWQEITTVLLDLPDDLVVAAVVRIAARELLRVADGGSLLPVPKGCVDPDKAWMLPPQAIDTAPAATVARAIARCWLARSDDKWFAGANKRIAQVTDELRAHLPASPVEEVA